MEFVLCGVDSGVYSLPAFKFFHMVSRAVPLFCDFFSHVILQTGVGVWFCDCSFIASRWL